MANRTCNVDGCERPYVARGWCSMHYQRWKANGDPGGPERIVAERYADGECDIDGCSLPVKSRGWCNRHYLKWSRYGDPLHTGRDLDRTHCEYDGCDRGGPFTRGYCSKHYSRWRRTGTSEGRGTTPSVDDPLSDPDTWFWPKVDVGHPLGCWEWTGHIQTSGYGQFRYRRSGQPHVAVVAHRVAYELLIGPIPDDRELDHLCRNRACVNPDHLEPVTKHENMLRGESPFAKNARKSRCVNGHDYTDANTYLTPDGRRSCRTCMRHAAARTNQTRRTR